MEQPVMVVDARSAPVGTAGVALVDLIETVIVGVVPVQPLQNSSTSALVSLPVTAGVKVWPAQLELLKPNPLFVTVVFCGSILAPLKRRTSPGLLVRSQLVGTPPWKSAWVVSVRQPLVGASVREKFWVRVRPSFTTMLEIAREW